MENFQNKTAIIKPLICVEIIRKTIPYTQIRYYDLVLLIPSLVFGLFLIFHCRSMFRNIFSGNSSIINTFYILLCFACGLKVIRSVVVMILKNDDQTVQIIDKVLWLIVRFFLLATEMSIITFGVAAAKLDTRDGIRRVLVVTSVISFTYTAIQAALEFALPDKRLNSGSYSLYGHGGALFFAVSSLFFFMVYCTILVLPFSGCSQRLRLPTKKMFYIYCAMLATLYLIEAVGSIMFYMAINEGLCFIDITTLVYYMFYDPLVYATFLHNYLKSRKTISFKYNQNVVEYPETSEDNSKSYSNYTNSTSANHFNNHSINCQKSDDFPDEMDDQAGDRGSHFYPDQLVTVERNVVDAMTINQIMKNYNIMSEGAQLDYTTRCPSSTPGFDYTNQDEKEKSIILSLSEEIDTRVNRRETWDLDDFTSGK